MVVMNLLFVIGTIFQIASISSKKLDLSSDESIENILFYKDYRPKTKEAQPLPPEPLILSAPPKQPECVPRMCCSMSCTNSCGQNEMSPDNQRMSMQYMNPMSSMNQMNPMNQMNQMNQMNPSNSMNSMNPGNPMNPMNNPISRAAIQSQRYIPPFNRHNKKKKPPLGPLPSRRSNSFTREHIKNLISQDQDIKKILKDLVRVTMQKVDLLELIKTRRAAEMKGDAALNNDDEEGKEL